MKGKRAFAVGLMLILLLALVVGPGRAQGPEPENEASPQAVVGTAFTYQGRLMDGGSPASGEYDFAFVLYDAAIGGTEVGFDVVNDKAVVDGLFTVQLEYTEDPLRDQARWLEVWVRPGSSDGAYTPLEPLQPLTPAPYALALPGLWTEQNATSPNVIGGYSGNSVTPGAVGATIGGGGESGKTNRVTGSFGTVGGGHGNRSGDDDADPTYPRFATVSGGYNNTASGSSATIGGGYQNEASEGGATVGGGYNNTASRSFATIGGGYFNTASGNQATVGGGSFNEASGLHSVVPGGYDNEASGEGSFAAGTKAQALHDGSFVLADSTVASFPSVREDALRTRFNGGAAFIVNNDHWVSIWDIGGMLINTDIGAHLTIGGVWTNGSDRDAKENFAPVDGEEVLARLADMPVQTWNYEAEDPSVRRMGPTAQDFYAAFGLGGSDTSIGTVDADGVALVSIQALYERSLALEAENAALQEKLADLEARVATLEEGQAGPANIPLLPGVGLLTVVGMVLAIRGRHLRPPKGGGR